MCFCWVVFFAVCVFVDLLWIFFSRPRPVRPSRASSTTGAALYRGKLICVDVCVLRVLLIRWFGVLFFCFDFLCFVDVWGVCCFCCVFCVFFKFVFNAFVF